MKAQPLKQTETGYEECEAKEATHVMLNMPGPLSTRIIPVILKGTRKGTNCWSWNGDTEKPTLKPSIRTKGTRDLTDKQIEMIQRGEKIEPEEVECHTWVNDGKAQFIGDSTHELAGQTIDLLDVD